MKIFYFVKKFFFKWHNLFAIFIHRYMDSMDGIGKEKKTKQNKTKYYYKNKENNIYPVYY